MELTIDQALQQGVAAHKEGKLEEAERFYRAILQSQPLHPDANHNLGLIAVSVNKAETALPLFKTSLEANPKIEQFWLSYIDALIKENQFETAKNVLAEGKKIGLAKDKVSALEFQIKQITLPKCSEKKKSLTLKEKRKKIAESKQQKKQAKSLRGNNMIPSQNAEAHNYLGNTLQELGKLDEAEVSYGQAIALKPDYVEAHYNLGNTLVKLGKLDEAVASYAQAVALKPDFTEAHYNFGVTLKGLGRLDDAKASYAQAISIKPDYAEAHNNLGVTLQELGRLDEAELSYTQAIALKPDDAQAHYNFGITLQELGRLDEAEASYTQAVALKPDYAEAYYNLGITLQGLSRLDEAEAIYTQVIVLKPDFVEAHNELGSTLKEQGRLDEAEASYGQALALKPGYAEAHNNLGVTLQELGRLDEAAVSYTQAIALRPGYADAFWNLHGIQKSIQSAEHWIDECLIADANYLEAKLTKAALRFYQGDKTEFDNLMLTEFKQHPYMRSFSWAFSLPHLPELHFNKFYFFDAIVKKSIISKPFYEFGVWRASSFKYLIRVFKKGYGFDTFTGLPEDWFDENGSVAEKAGTYTSDGNVPDIRGAEFIVGKFEDTLPVFFSESRPVASVINFDADLYSSTICALNYSKSVMDKDTILIFDEFIINQSWEQDEFKALNEFCSINQCSYEVVAISFSTKQVAVKLMGI